MTIKPEDLDEPLAGYGLPSGTAAPTPRRALHLVHRVERIPADLYFAASASRASACCAHIRA